MWGYGPVDLPCLRLCQRTTYITSCNILYRIRTSKKIFFRKKIIAQLKSWHIFKQFGIIRIPLEHKWYPNPDPKNAYYPARSDSKTQHPEQHSHTYQYHISMLAFHHSNCFSIIKRMLICYRHISIFAFLVTATLAEVYFAACGSEDVIQYNKHWFSCNWHSFH